MASTNDHVPDRVPLVLDVGSMTDEELEALANLLVDMQDARVAELKGEPGPI